MAYKLTTDFYYPLAEIYKGSAEKAQFTFSSPPVGEGWYADQMIDSFEEEVVKHGESILRLKIYEDHAPLMETKFFCEATITASPIAPLVWVAIIAACLVILGIVTYKIVKILDTHWPEVAKTAKWVGIGIAAVAAAVTIGLVSRALPKKEGKYELG